MSDPVVLFFFFSIGMWFDLWPSADPLMAQVVHGVVRAWDGQSLLSGANRLEDGQKKWFLSALLPTNEHEIAKLTSSLLLPLGKAPTDSCISCSHVKIN